MMSFTTNLNIYHSIERVGLYMALKRAEQNISLREKAFIMSHQRKGGANLGIFDMNPRDAVLIAAVRSDAPLRDVMTVLSRIDEEARFVNIV